MQDLATKYRPSKFEQVIGQKSTVASLKRLVTGRTKHALCFTGLTGTGKTTLARICARELGTGDGDLMEVDAATNTGIDVWRALRPSLQYAPMGPAGSSRTIIVDEAHGLSKQAWQSLLKDVEEPPEHLFWMFCTTEPNKVPTAIRNRCAMFAMRPVASIELWEHLGGIADKEKFAASDELLDLIVRNSRGSVRQALAFLETCGDRDIEEAAQLMETVADERKPTELAFGLLNRTLEWADIVKIVASLQDKMPAEGLRRIMVAIMANSLLKKTRYKDAEPVLAALEALQTPFPSDSKAAELLVPLGRLLRG